MELDNTNTPPGAPTNASGMSSVTDTEMTVQVTTDTATAPGPSTAPRPLHDLPELADRYVPIVSTALGVEYRNPYKFSLKPPCWTSWQHWEYRAFAECLEQFDLTQVARVLNKPVQEVSCMLNALAIQPLADAEEASRRGKSGMERWFKVYNELGTPMREWTDEDPQVRGELDNTSKGKVYLVLENGNKYVLNVDRLSEVDKVYLEESVSLENRKIMYEAAPDGGDRDQQLRHWTLENIKGSLLGVSSKGVRLALEDGRQKDMPLRLLTLRDRKWVREYLSDKDKQNIFGNEPLAASSSAGAETVRTSEGRTPVATTPAITTTATRGTSQAGSPEKPSNEEAVRQPPQITIEKQGRNQTWQRDWTDAKLVGTLSNVSPNILHIRLHDGGLIHLPLDRLNQADKNWLNMNLEVRLRRVLKGIPSQQQKTPGAVPRQDAARDQSRGPGDLKRKRKDSDEGIHYLSNTEASTPKKFPPSLGSSAGSRNEEDQIAVQTPIGQQTLTIASNPSPAIAEQQQHNNPPIAQQNLPPPPPAHPPPAHHPPKLPLLPPNPTVPLTPPLPTTRSWTHDQIPGHLLGVSHRIAHLALPDGARRDLALDLLDAGDRAWIRGNLRLGARKVLSGRAREEEEDAVGRVGE